MKNKKILIPTLSAAVILLAVSVWYFRYRTSQPTISKPTPTRASASADSQKGQPVPSTKYSTNSAQPGDAKNNADTDTSATLVAPSGTFVSNHSPGQNGSPLTEVSVCNSTPGATCQIQFTNGSVTKSLPAQVTDRSGSTYWNNWTAASIGLIAGSWQVKATATLGSQTLSTTDQMNLVVQ